MFSRVLSRSGYENKLYTKVTEYSVKYQGYINIKFEA
jgi:hypothetical protein